jgi:hypothetical protein
MINFLLIWNLGQARICKSNKANVYYVKPFLLQYFYAFYFKKRTVFAMSGFLHFLEHLAIRIHGNTNSRIYSNKNKKK